MPGLQQLKRFSSDILNLGDEVKIRASRGEKPGVVPLPQGISPDDDSEEFKDGLPMVFDDAPVSEDGGESAADDFSDANGEGAEASGGAKTPDMSNLLSPMENEDINDLDLSEFETPVVPEPPKETPLEDLDLNALLTPSNPSETESMDSLDSSDLGTEEAVEPDVDVPGAPDLSFLDSQKDSAPSEPAYELPALDGMLDELPEPETVDAPESAANAVDDSDSQAFAEPDVDITESSPDSPAPEESGDDTDAGAFDDIPAFEDNAEPADASIPRELSEEDFALPNIDETAFGGSAEAPEQAAPDFDETVQPEHVADDGAMNSAADGFDDSVGINMNEGLNETLNEVIPANEMISDEDVANRMANPEDESGAAESLDDGSADDVVPLDENSDDAPPSEDSAEPDPLMQDGDGFSLDGLDQLGDVPEAPEDDFKLSDDNLSFDFDLPDNAVPETSVDTSAESPSPDEADGSVDAASEQTDGGAVELPDFGSDEFGFDTSGLDEPASFDSTESAEDGESEPAVSDDADASQDTDPTEPDTDTAGVDGLPDFGMDDNSTFSMDETPVDFGDSTPTPDAMPNESAVDDEPAEQFDTTNMDGLDFGDSSGAGPTDFEMGGVVASGDDDLFSIPGFSDTTGSANFKKPQVETPDFSGAAESTKPKNSFTDAEYENFKENLATYPLNVRIALEDLIVKNEFTDDAVFGILEKVLRRVPARQLAAELEKMLDIHLEVPRDYERRTAAEYEQYKQSFEYQLKNKIIPMALVSTLVAGVLFCISALFYLLVWQPAMATHLYKQGYTLIQHNEYPQSETLFNRALTFKPMKKWFFRYGDAYRDHRQYERAANMYRAVLQRYNHDKRAGLSWASMEMNDLFNYEETERILKREVLDFHINDAEAVLMLGDLYLEWATEKDPDKFPAAKEQYDLLLQLYGSTKAANTYLARQMRYHIRTDNLRQVLGYKEYFMPLKKALGAADLTELSGYLLDKRYGRLKPSEEGLRFSIEDVRELLERAVRADAGNPVALYNLGRYFVITNNDRSASRVLQSALDAFGKQTVRGKRDTYRYINAWRLRGEQYCKEREYIMAEEAYTSGISLFEAAHADGNFESTEDIGALYADMADLDYFISGNMENALRHYKNAVDNNNDTASVRYRIGFIQYTNQNYAEALGSFIRSHEGAPDDMHLLLALANTLSQRNDNNAAQGYYEKLLQNLDKERELHGVLFPQVRDDQADIVDTYMKASNNLGVIQSRIATATGNSVLNGRAIVHLQESLRAWDALTRNQETMVRLEGSNLAEQNIRYISKPISDYEPQIYTGIPRMLTGEEGLR